MKKTFRQCAIDYIKHRHLCKGYVDYIVSQLEKFEKIEQIIDDCDLEAWEILEMVKEVLKQE